MSTTTTNRALAWGLLAIAALANIAGYALNLYQQFVWFDEVLHAYTIFAITLVLALFLYGASLTGPHDHRLLLVLTIASVGLAIGALWEVAEWGYDQVVSGNAIKGKTDTSVDLIMDSLGALVAGGLAVWMVRREAANRP